MAYQTYSEKLQNPLWQKKRLSILNRDGFACQLCKGTKSSLHVHHFCYNKNYNPWDVEDSSLITYCKQCHAVAEYYKSDQIHLLVSIKKVLTDKNLIVIKSLLITGDKKSIGIGYYDNDIYTHLITLKEETIQGMIKDIQEL